MRTNAVESVSSTPMPGLYSSWTGVRWMWFEANRFGLRGLGVDIAQCDHETVLVADLAGVDNRFFPAILLTSEK
jgi:hypothetical protein